MSTIGMQTWGSEGDVQPFLALAGGLAQAGHEVILSIASARDVAYAPPHARVAIERVAGEASLAEGAALVQRVAALRSPLAQVELVMKEAFDPHVEALRAASESLVARCDVIVRHHFLHMARYVAEQRGVPEVSVFLTPDLLPTRAHPPTGMPSLGPLQGLAWWMMRTAAGRMVMPSARAVSEALGLARPRDLIDDVWTSRTANLIGVSPAMFSRPADWPQTHHLTGFFRGPRTHSAALAPSLEAFLSAGAPPLYASFGSMTPHAPEGAAQTLDLWTQAARATGHRLIAQLSGLDVGAPAEDVLIVEGSPHAQVFPRCAAVIHHGGAGTTQTAARAGRPSVIVPHLADQFFWAAQVKRLGVGVATGPRARVTPKQLARAVEAALGASQRLEQAHALGAALDAEDGVAAGVAIITGAIARV